MTVGTGRLFNPPPRPADPAPAALAVPDRPRTAPPAPNTAAPRSARRPVPSVCSSCDPMGTPPAVASSMRADRRCVSMTDGRPPAEHAGDVGCRMGTDVWRLGGFGTGGPGTRRSGRPPSHRSARVSGRQRGPYAGKRVSTVRKTSVNRRCSMCTIPRAASNVLTCTDSYSSLAVLLTPEGPLSRFALIKAVLGPIMRLMFRPQVEGAEHIPGDGPVILAGNHLTFIDSMILPLVCDRQVFFIGKDEYVT